jgi:peroxiredoxin Q/BCP
VEKKGAQVVGISTDSVETLRKFKEEFKLPFALLSDADGTVADQFGGRVPVLGLANRATFVLDRDGTIREIVSGSGAIDPSSAITACSSGKG